MSDDHVPPARPYRPWHDKPAAKPAAAPAPETNGGTPPPLSETIPQQDKNEALKFLSWLDRNATFFTFQTFDDNDKREDRKLTRILHGSLDVCWAELVRLNNEGAGIFVTINETDRKGREAKNIVRVRCVFADLDGSPLEPVVRHKQVPHIVVVSSPGRWHAYWQVDGLRLGEFENVQKRLIKRFNSDPKVKDLPRVMRLPGFLHRKGTPFLIHIIQTNDKPPYPADYFRDPATKEMEQEIERTCQTVREATEGNRNDELNKAAFLLGQWVGADLLDEDAARNQLTDAAAAAGLRDNEIRKTLDSGITAGKKESRFAGKILDPANPMRSARAMAQAKYITEHGRILHRHRSTFWWWTGSYYQLIDDETLRADIWQYLENAHTRSKDGKLTAFKPTRDRVSNVLEALTAVCQLEKNTMPPVWLNDQTMPAAMEFFACKNGLLHLPSRLLYPPTSDYFGLFASEVSFNEDAPYPSQWMKFLEQVFGDEETIAAAQEWCGYTLTADTSQQKILFCVGPRRSGKGTLARVQSALLGRSSVAGPTMSQLGENFGLEPLITKPLAIVSDARIGGRTDKSVIVERLLSISGEDTMTVPRKFMPAWTGRLPTRFEIMTNELPSLSEGSGALVGRFIVIIFQQSFYGKEDVGLTARLLTELPGILNWAIEGYHRLRSRGYFVQPKNAQDQIDAIEMLGAPIKAFIRDACIVGPEQSVTVDKLFSAYQVWCEEEGRRDPGSKEWFGRNLHSAVPGLRIIKPQIRDDEEPWKRVRLYQGIGLAKPEEDIGEQLRREPGRL
jgi:P4 family phage/plasmid primase-like protien